MNATLKQYLPALGSVVVVLVTVLAGALTDDRLTTPEIVVILIATLTAFTTYVVPRVTEWPWLKIVVTALLAAFNALQGYLTDGLTNSELLLVAVAGLGALGVVGVTSKFAPLHQPVTQAVGGQIVDPDARRDERGVVQTGLIWTVVGVLLIIVLVVWLLNHT